VFENLSRPEFIRDFERPMRSKLPDEAKAACDAASTKAAQRKLFVKIVWRSRDY
jgi:hypothetical protein